MSFIPVNETAKIKKVTDEPKFGTVMYNNDPQMLGRIKVQIPGIFEGEEDELPWIRRSQSNFLAGDNCSCFSVPSVGSRVEVVWPYDDATPFYRGTPVSSRNGCSNFSEDYPNSWGFTDGTFLFIVNSATNTFKLSNGNATVSIDEEGNVNLTGCNNVNISGATNVTIEAGTVKLNANTVNIQGINWMSHQHANGNNGSNTGGVVA